MSITALLNSSISTSDLAMTQFELRQQTQLQKRRCSETTAQTNSSHRQPVDSHILMVAPVMTSLVRLAEISSFVAVVVRIVCSLERVMTTSTAALAMTNSMVAAETI